jgi:hypothetical protein
LLRLLVALGVGFALFIPGFSVSHGAVPVLLQHQGRLLDASGVVGGAHCDGTDWVNASDENAKENFEQVDGAGLLEKLSDLEITKWDHKGNDAAEHIGPAAQGFKNAIGVGADDKSISTIDPSEIALAAVKELYAQLKRKDAEIQCLQEVNAKQLEELRQQLSALQAAVNEK